MRTVRVSIHTGVQSTTQISPPTNLPPCFNSHMGTKCYSGQSLSHDLALFQVTQGCKVLLVRNCRSGCREVSIHTWVQNATGDPTSLSLSASFNSHMGTKCYPLANALLRQYLVSIHTWVQSATKELGWDRGYTRFQFTHGYKVLPASSCRHAWSYLFQFTHGYKVLPH